MVLVLLCHYFRKSKTPIKKDSKSEKNVRVGMSRLMG